MKGKSSLMIYEKFGNLKFKYRNREFWCRGYYVYTVGKNAKKIAEYIKNQLEEDKIGKQMEINYKNVFLVIELNVMIYGLYEILYNRVKHKNWNVYLT